VKDRNGDLKFLETPGSTGIGQGKAGELKKFEQKAECKPIIFSGIQGSVKRTHNKDSLIEYALNHYNLNEDLGDSIRNMFPEYIKPFADDILKISQEIEKEEKNGKIVISASEQDKILQMLHEEDIDIEGLSDESGGETEEAEEYEKEVSEFDKININQGDMVWADFIYDLLRENDFNPFLIKDIFEILEVDYAQEIVNDLKKLGYKMTETHMVGMPSWYEQSPKVLTPQKDDEVNIHIDPNNNSQLINNFKIFVYDKLWDDFTIMTFEGKTIDEFFNFAKYQINPLISLFLSSQKEDKNHEDILLSNANDIFNDLKNEISSKVKNSGEVDVVMFQDIILNFIKENRIALNQENLQYLINKFKEELKRRISKIYETDETDQSPQQSTYDISNADMAMINKEYEDMLNQPFDSSFDSTFMTDETEDLF
jgi:hypothetical protein